MSRPSPVHAVPANGAPPAPPSVESLSVPCPYCGDARACCAALIDLVEHCGHLSLSASRQGSDARQPVHTVSLRVVCGSCHDTGRVLTAEGLALLRLLPPEVVRAACEAARDADIPF